jgi:ribA/ribD-fused uncharacterized protein
MKKDSNIREYARSESIIFRSTRAKYGAFSNMAGNFPLSVNGKSFFNAEALYQCCRFPRNPTLQHTVASERSPMSAKSVARLFESETREDWFDVRVRIMRWTLRIKLLHYFSTWGQLLLSTGDHPIVEESPNDLFWGASRSPKNPNTLVGGNVLGRLLMGLRQEMQNGTLCETTPIPPPDIKEFLLFGEPILTLSKASIILPPQFQLIE